MRQQQVRRARRTPSRPGVLGFSIAVLAAALVLVQSGATTSHAAGGPTWWKVDLHEHSAFSGDARADIALDAYKAKQQNYNAVFLTDHDRGSGFQIGGSNGNTLAVTDSLSTQWTSKVLPSNLPSGSSATAPTAVSSPVHSGSASIHMAVTSSSSTIVHSFTYDDRGMGLRSGNILLDFWAYPQTISPSSSAGLSVSLALGGDANAGPTPFGYTTSDGVVHPGKSTVLVWQLGTARASSSNGTTDVYANPLQYSTGKWNHYVINVTTGQVQWTPTGGSTTTSSSTGLNGLGADAPADYAVTSYVKMEAAAANGTADGYFDDFSLKVASPQCTSTEFAYRNSLIPQFAGTNQAGQQFLMLPAREMGQNNHANQFNFGITSASQYKDTFTDSVQDDNALCAGTNQANAPWQFSKLGTDNIPAVQASGYPAQDNHPGVTDSTADVIGTNAHGADAVEARTGADYTATWDSILQKGVVIMGTEGSDAHEGVGSTTPSMYIDAPSLTLNDLMHSYFEGRMYGAPGNFGGRIVFNLDGSAAPYPARYPVYVPSTQASATVNLQISGGLSASSQKVRWVYSNAGGPLQVTDITPSGSSYSSGQRTIPLSGAYTYVRAAVWNPTASANTIANTEPIFFKSVSGMPAGMSARVDSITPPSGTCSCTIAMTKGITSISYSGSTLSMGLTNPAGSGVQMLVQSAQAPTGVNVDGSPAAPAGSLANYLAGTSTSWFYDGSAKLLYIRDNQASGTSTVAASFGGGGGGDTTAPSVPTGLTATPFSSSRIDLSWNASTDNSGGSGVAGYNVYRDGTKVNVALITGTTFSDTGLAPSTTYGYTVSAVDNANNESAQSSPPKSATTQSGGGGGGSLTFNPVADSYVDSSAPTANYGKNTKLRVDTSPTVNSFLRFSVSGLSGSVTGVQLKIEALSNLSAGFAVDAVSNDSWGETTITSSNAPSLGAQLALSGAATTGSYVTITLPASAVTGNGNVDFALVGRSSTALALASRESATPPQLIVTTSGGGGSDSTPPSVPTGLSATPFSSSRVDLVWNASTDNSGGSGVAGYNVYRDGTKVNSSPIVATSYSDTGLQASTTYNYTVSAVDNASNESAQSSPPQPAKTLAGTDSTPPSVPTGLSATPFSSSRVDLVWNASTDNSGGSGVAGYNVYRDGTKVNSSPIVATSYSDTGLQASTTYNYTVSAVDNASNESAQSSPPQPAQTLSGGGGGTLTFNPVADAYVDSSTPTTTFGTSTKLRVDGSPTVNSFLRFSVSGLSGTVTSVTLKIFATSNLSAGFAVKAVSDDTWTEGITYNTAPSVGSSLANSSAAVANSYVTVTLPSSAVSGNGDVSFALVGLSTTALALTSRESATPPQLVVSTS